MRSRSSTPDASVGIECSPHGGDAAKSQKREACEARVPIVTLVPQISLPLQCHRLSTPHSLPFLLNLEQRG